MTGLLTFLFFPLGVIGSATIVALIFTALAVISPLLIIGAAFKMGGYLADRLSQWLFNSSSNENNTPSNLKYLRTITLPLIFTLLALPVAAIVVPLVAGILVPLIFVVLAFVLSFALAKLVINISSSVYESYHNDIVITESYTHIIQENSGFEPIQSPVQSPSNNPTRAEEEPRNTSIAGEFFDSPKPRSPVLSAPDEAIPEGDSKKTI